MSFFGLPSLHQNMEVDHSQCTNCWYRRLNGLCRGHAIHFQILEGSVLHSHGSQLAWSCKEASGEQAFGGHEGWARFVRSKTAEHRLKALGLSAEIYKFLRHIPQIEDHIVRLVSTFQCRTGHGFFQPGWTEGTSVLQPLSHDASTQIHETRISPTRRIRTFHGFPPRRACAGYLDQRFVTRPRGGAGESQVGGPQLAGGLGSAWAGVQVI